MNAQDNFLTAYNTLNTEQKRAVDAIEGPVMVIAGPGTGKTQILTIRIARILEKTQTEPENILALTFTEPATYNMRRRLASMIGNPAYRVPIQTFHGFCDGIIHRYPEDFPRIIGSKSITEIDQVGIVENIIETESLVLLKPFGDRFLYVRDIVAAIGDLKREGITPERFLELIKEEQEHFKNISDLYHEKGAYKGKMKSEYQKLERKILKNEELAKVYKLYQEALTLHKQYDFNDMILEVLETLKKNEALLQMLQEEYQYVLVDEHQDTNNAQNKIIELLMSFHPNPNLFVVGDDKQAIFRFQGASLENFYYFKSLYPEALLITLTQNYRSTKTILSHADTLLSGGAPLQKNASYAEEPINVGAFPNAAYERFFIVHDIRKKIDTGIPPQEIAVLYRNNNHAFPIARDLERLGIAYQIESDQDLFSHKDIRTLLVILEAVGDYGNDIHVTPLLHLSLFGIDPLDVYKILRNAADRKKHTLYDVLTTASLLEEISLKDKESVISFASKLKIWVMESRKRDLGNFFEYIIRESGLLEDMLGSNDAVERFDAVNTLFDEVRTLLSNKPDVTIQEFFMYVETVRKHNLFLKRKKQISASGRVRLMTVHKSKGLEFSHVYIVGVVNGVFGGKIDRDRLPLIDSIYKLTDSDPVDTKQQNFDDERRLFYVALTRAKESITITYSSQDDGGKEMLPSEFLSELRTDEFKIIPVENTTNAFKNDRGFIFRETLGTEGNDGITKEFVSELFRKQGLSPTALNNYLDCPWRYFYQNLLRIPASQNKHQAYGTAVHSALNTFLNQLPKEPVGKPYLLSSFISGLNSVPLSPTDYEESKIKGEKALSGWYDTYEGTWNLRAKNEFPIRGIMLREDICLTGVLDKVEWNDDDTVNVIDYKTGKPKTRNELMGKTKDSDGNYYRQLTFYKILLNHYRDGEYHMAQGIIDFIEPDDKGRYHQESFEIEGKDVEELTQTIFRVADEVQNLDFWDKTCSDKDCEFCALRSLINQAK